MKCFFTSWVLRGAPALLAGAFLFSGGVVGCAHGATKSQASVVLAHPEEQWTSVKLAAPVILRLGDQKNQKDVTKYSSLSASDTYESGELRVHQDEDTTFDAHTFTIASDDQKFTDVVTVDHKTGGTDLHEMAMPDLGEKLEMTLSRNGKVLGAGGYPHNSIFYVPQVSLPAGPVSVGDTWEMQAAWVSLDGEYPFSMTMVSIFKGVYQCGPKESPDQCADIELSGQIAVGGDDLPLVGFKNDWQGRLLLAIKAGKIVWSSVVSDENYAAEAVTRKVRTTLDTKLTEPAGYLPDNLAR